MSRPYSIKTFLRTSSNHFIEQYLKRENISLDIDFTELKESKIDALLEAIGKIDDAKKRQEMDSNFQRIHQMAFEAGIQKIIAVAALRDVEILPSLEQQKGLIDKVFYVFLHQNELFEDAFRFACTEYLSARYWRKFKNLKPLIEPDYSNCCEALQRKIGEYFRKNEGRGNSCQVDYYVENQLHYYFCYPEDYSRAALVWERGNFKRQVSSPAFEVIFVYDAESYTLDSYFQGDIKTDKNLKEIFVQEVLRLHGLPEKEEVVYNLDVIKAPDFQFDTAANPAIKKVEIEGIRFVTTHRKVIIKEHAPKDSIAALLADIQRTSQTVRVNADTIDQIMIKVTLESDNRKGEAYRRFNIAYPSSCNLKYDKNDLAIRQMIIDSGIEQRPEEQEQKVA